MASEKNIDGLKSELKELRKQMGEALNVNQKTLIDELINQLNHADTLPTTDSQELTNKLNQELTSFISNHPRLANVLREIVDQLNKMGV